MSYAPLVFIIAGEASGDLLGAQLMKTLKGARFAGIGGATMQAEGLQSLFPMEELSLMGLSIFLKLPSLLKRLRQTVQTIQTLKPDAVITIDAPEFSFRVMKRLHKLSHRPRLIHYVAPTVWAWRPGRAEKVAQILDHLLCLYPFEPPYFEKYGLPATFVGHPIANEEVPTFQRDPNLICVLPGSRISEINRLLPIFTQTLSQFPNAKVVVPTLPSIAPLINVPGWDVVVGDKARRQAFAQASIALAASGTVALQLAAAGLPFIIAYKLGAFSAMLAKRLLITPWACMVNILLQRPCVPEYLQENCTPEKLADGLRTLDKGAEKVGMAQAIKMLKAPLDKAAKVVLNELEKSQEEN